MARIKKKKGEVLSFLDKKFEQVSALVHKAWIRPLGNGRVKLVLSVFDQLPPVWCDAITAVHLITDDESEAEYQVLCSEKNGSTLAFELAPVTSEDAARVLRRRTHFTNVQNIGLQVANTRVEFKNTFYLPAT